MRKRFPQWTVALVVGMASVLAGPMGWNATQNVAVAKKKKPTFRSIWWIFKQYKCAKCHYTQKVKGKVFPPPMGLDMSSPKLAYKHLVGVQSVQAREGILRVNNYAELDGASRVAYSYLIYKLLGTHKNFGNIGGSGAQMPLGSNAKDKKGKKKVRVHKVPDRHIHKIIKWISSGATY